MNSLLRILRKREVSLIIVLVVLSIVIQTQNPRFLTADFIGPTMQNYAVTILMAVGMMLVLLVGGIDISVASTLSLSGMATGIMIREGIITGAFSAYAFSTGVGLACGLLVGLVIAKGKVLPIIATLGFMYAFRGLSFFIADGRWVGFHYLMTVENYVRFSQGSSLGVSNLIWITFVVYAVMFVITKWTKPGRRVYAVGSSADSAEIGGIRADRVKIFVYAVNGALAGLAGAMHVGLYANAAPQIATGLELDIIAACVIGGVSLRGGQGTVVGVLLGAVIMMIINSTLSLMGIDHFWQQVLKGAVILLAVMANIMIQRAAIRRTLSRREL